MTNYGGNSAVSVRSVRIYGAACSSWSSLDMLAVEHLLDIGLNSINKFGMVVCQDSILTFFH